MKFVNPGRALGLSSTAARTRYDNLKRAVESGLWPPIETGEATQSGMVQPALYHYLILQKRNRNKPKARTTDPVVEMLASRAATDIHLKNLMKVAAAGTATPDQLRGFQAYVDDLTAIVTEQEATREAKADELISKSKQEKLSAEPVVESARMPTNGTTNGQVETSDSGGASDVEILEVDEIRARSTNPKVRKRASGVAELEPAHASDTKRRSTRIRERQRMIESSVAGTGTNSFGAYDSTDLVFYDSDSEPVTAASAEPDVDSVDTVYKGELLDLRQWQKPQAALVTTQSGTLPKQKRMANASRKPRRRRVAQMPRRTCRICKSTTHKCTHGENDSNHNLYASYGDRPSPSNPHQKTSTNAEVRATTEDEGDGCEDEVEVLDLS